MSIVARRCRAGARRGWRDERGAAAVELALVLPILILLLFGIIEFARAWNVRQTLTDSAREGARIAVVNNAMMSPALLADSVRRVVRSTATRAGLDLAELTITPTGMSSGQVATVLVEYRYNPLFGLVLKNPIVMRTTSSMRNE